MMDLFILNQKYFNYMTGLTMTNEKFSKLFKNPVSKPEKEKLTQFHMDIASSIQKVIEYVVLNMIKFLSKIKFKKFMYGWRSCT